MNRIKFLLLTIISSTLFFSCKKDDDSVTAEPPRDRTVQYVADLVTIENYLKSHYLTVTTDAHGNPIPTINAIASGGTQTSIWDQTEYPLSFEMLKNDTRSYTNANPYIGDLIDDPVEYKVYYIKLREGTGNRPSEVDSTHIAYRGTNMTDIDFDYQPNPIWLRQDEVISGWRQIMKKFKTGSAVDDPSNPGNVIFSDHGVGIMFIPSGLGYYDSPRTNLPAYSPMVFTFNLISVRYLDTDGDGIPSYLEDLNGNGDLYDDDTDGDGFPNFLDNDDDGDGFLTLMEISDSFGNKYPFDLIPNCQGTTGGLKKYLDPSCH